MKEPSFLRKPKHKETVVATSQGWVVERTGEILVRVRDLDKKIFAHFGEVVETDIVDDLIKDIDTQDVTETENKEDIITQLINVIEQVNEQKTEEIPAPKKRGRPAKQKA